MIRLIQLLFPEFRPAPTVENAGVSMASMAVPGVVDDCEAEDRLVALIDGPLSAD